MIRTIYPETIRSKFLSKVIVTLYVLSRVLVYERSNFSIQQVDFDIMVIVIKFKHSVQWSLCIIGRGKEDRGYVEFDNKLVPCYCLCALSKNKEHSAETIKDIRENGERRENHD